MSLFEKELANWFKKNQRDLPWRRTDPWGVLVSEIMLQQTPVARVLPVYNLWMERWPSARELAGASPADVITAWGRLGYPRRALRLHECARVIARDFNNKVPETEIELRSLPGVGEYTSAAIMAFAFKERSLVLDINVRRVFARAIDGVEVPTLSVTRDERKVRAEIIPDRNPHIWAAATMELGAVICTSQSPKCGLCPIADQCKWRNLDYPKSAQIKRTQSWNGTDRQCRGVIVQALRENKSLTKGQITKLWSLQPQVEKALVSLQEDGLIAKVQRNSYALPTS
jgi:A/G-specific adenine glycosylase